MLSSWATKLAQRVQALPPGRHMLIVTVRHSRPNDWTVLEMGKVETAGGVEEGVTLAECYGVDIDD